MAKIVYFLIFITFFTGCSIKQPVKSESVTVVFKTPHLKFHDKGFLTKYDDHIHLQVFNAGTSVLDIQVYKDKICQSTFECIDALQFNKNYFSKNYDEGFFYELLNNQKIYYKNKKDKILIKIEKK